MEILKDIHWVGAIDWNLRTFHGHTYNTLRGSTYNAYLILDEKITLVDTVLGSFADEILEKIRAIADPKKIEYIVSNHVETDHSGALPAIMRFCPKAKVICSAKGKEGIYKNYYGDWDFQVVKTGDTLNIGKRTLSFIEAPMIHWPDSMFTYSKEDALLMPNDAFGQHYATSARFDDEVSQEELMDEAAKYYANILMPLGPIILKKIEEIRKMNIPVKMIAPSHGIIWRKAPQQIIESYISWAKSETKKKIIVVYETMWGSTAKMALKIAQGITDAGYEVRLYDINVSDRTEINRHILDAKGIVIGSSTHDNDMLSNIAGFLEFLKGLRPKGKSGFVFGSYGWSGGAVTSIENVLKEAGIELIRQSLQIKYVPDEAELKSCYDLGFNFARGL